MNVETLQIARLRDTLYDILIYSFNVHKCMCEVLSKLISREHFPAARLGKVFSEMGPILKCYNNNYRPIYHLERFCIYLATVVHEP